MNAPANDPSPQNASSFPIVAEEEGHLARMRQHLLEHPDGANTSDQASIQEMARLRQEIGGAKTEDQGAMLQQYDQLDFLVRQIRTGRDNRRLDPDSPYFGHLGIEVGGVTQNLFLGRATRCDGDIRIVDWRNAPVSGIFYRHREGDDFEETFGDLTVAGKVSTRRTLNIRQGELRRVEADNDAWIRETPGWVHVPRSRPRLAGGSGAAWRGWNPGSRLGTGRQHRADKHLPEIAALIDPHQFELITEQPDGIVAIRGSAGSGKTTVALHRVAWLSYMDPRRFRPGRMLVMVWSKALKNYVSHVLPSLGADGIHVATWSTWAHRLRVIHYPRLPAAVRDDSPAPVTQVKLHPATLEILERRIRRRVAPPSPKEALDDFVSFLADGQMVARELAARPANTLSPSLLEAAARGMEDQATALRVWLEGDRSGPSMLDPEDDALLLRIWQVRVGPLQGRCQALRYAHIAIDEVQDFSPLEVRVLLDCQDAPSATLAGDTLQHISADSGFTDWHDFFALLGLQSVVVDTLNVAYRSTRQITEFALAILGDRLNDEAVPLTTREGPVVELLRFTDHGACVAFLADALRDLVRDEPLASVALLAATPAVAHFYHQSLARAQVPGLRKILHQEFCFKPGIEVTLVRDVKGLEFDYVVLLEASARQYPDTDLSSRLLHVGATRAIHQLWVTVVETPAASLREEVIHGLP